MEWSPVYVTLQSFAITLGNGQKGGGAFFGVKTQMKGFQLSVKRKRLS